MPIGTEIIINKDISYSVIQVGHGGSVVPEPYLDSWIFLHLHNETRYSLICLPTVSSDAPTVPFACLMTSELFHLLGFSPHCPTEWLEELRTWARLARRSSVLEPQALAWES